MKKGLIALVIILAIGAIWGTGIYNGLIDLDENVEEAWGNVESSYQRRNDLIDNLVNTVQGAADFERKTLTDVIEARAKATTINIDPSNTQDLEKLAAAQEQLTGALSRLLVTVERYPDLKSNQSFLKLQDELASTENEIRTVRVRYNEAIRPYNSKVRRVPSSMVAGMTGFDPKPYFESEDGADKPSEVEFDFD